MTNNLTLKTAIRTALMGSVLVAGSQTAFADGIPPHEMSANEKKPNIVLMMADNLGYGDLGVYGGGESRGMPTPNIDKLASEGLRFGQFLVEPGCTPSRAATMIGRYSIRAGLSSVIMQGTPNTLQKEEVTMAEMLKQVGYNTAVYGKWHLGFEKKSQPQNQGFDEFYGIAGSTGEITYTSSMREHGITPDNYNAIPCIYEVRPVIRKPRKEVKCGDDPKRKTLLSRMRKVKAYNDETRRTIDVEIADKSINYINEQQTEGKPFFLFISWTRPHFPNYTSKAFEGSSRIGLYGDSVMELDHNTGRVLKAIKDNGIEDNTIVIWMSDNGPMRSVVWPDSGFQGPFRGELGDPFEGSIRTAGMIKWPGKIQPGVTYGMFSCMDFFPTLANFAGVDIPPNFADTDIPPNVRPIDGIDQADFLLNHDGEEKVESKRDHLLTFQGDEMMAVRWKQFRLYFTDILPQEGLTTLGGGASRSTPTLGQIIYNIEQDPREENNVALRTAWIIPFVQEHIAGYLKSLKDHPNPPAVHISNLQEYIKECSKNPELPACQPTPK